LLNQYWKESEPISQLVPEFADTNIRLDTSSTQSTQGKYGEENHRARPQQLNPSLSAAAERRRKPQPHLWWGIAASLLLLISLFFYLGGAPEFLGNREIVYTTGFGERLEVELNDGSHITLNANSELRWSEEWKEKGNRQAILKGEAFFEVKKQNGIP